VTKANLYFPCNISSHRKDSFSPNTYISQGSVATHLKCGTRLPVVITSLQTFHSTFQKLVIYNNPCQLRSLKKSMLKVTTYSGCMKHVANSYLILPWAENRTVQYSILVACSLVVVVLYWLTIINKLWQNLHLSHFVWVMGVDTLKSTIAGLGQYHTGW